jgi:hypothetical protein
MSLQHNARIVHWAAEVAARELSATPRRWAHVRGVAKCMENLAPYLDNDAEIGLAAAWLHDIGYAPHLQNSGFHPLDGSRHLQRLGFPDRVCVLVANHSWALIEADLRGLGDTLRNEFPQELSSTADALCYADLTTSPTGLEVQVEDRLAEVIQRYGVGSVVATFIETARPRMLAAVRRTETRTGR